MARLILLFVVLTAFILAVRALFETGQRLARTPALAETGDRNMPPFVTKMSYVALIILMFGAATGALEGF